MAKNEAPQLKLWDISQLSVFAKMFFNFWLRGIPPSVDKGRYPPKLGKEKKSGFQARAKADKIILGLIFLAGVLLFTQNLARHGIEYRDDEIFYFNSTREMVRSGDVLSPKYFGENRFQKPILFYWLILLSYKVFGLNWFAARFVAVIFAALTLCLTWSIARRLFNQKIAWLSVLILTTIPLFFRHAKNAVPDMVLNFSIVFALYCAMKFFEDPGRKKYTYLFFISCALGFMIKGFAAIVVPFLTVIVYALLSRRSSVLWKINFPLGLTILGVIILPWFLYMISLHGAQYTNYVVKAETLNRLVASSEQNAFLKTAAAFSSNSVFYLKTMLSYFAPWSIFAIVGIPWAVFSAAQKSDQTRHFLFLLVWFFAAFFFFSSIFARINHLILVLTTPFAILVSYFLLQVFEPGTLKATAIRWGRKSMAVLIVIFGIAGYVVLRVFLVGSSKLWLPFLIVLGAVAVIAIIRSRDTFTAPALAALFIIFIYSQSGLISQAGLISHSTLQRFAQTIEAEMDHDSVIGVGSHDIHEKELQAYFDRKVEKAQPTLTGETRRTLMEFLQQEEDAYCLLTEQDYEQFVEVLGIEGLEIVQEEFIFRRRIRVDREFLSALFRLEQDKVHNYLMEKVVLIRKGSHA